MPTTNKTGEPAVRGEMQPAASEGSTDIECRLFGAVMQGVDDAILARDRNGRIVYANDIGARLLGFSSASELIATPLEEISSRYEFYDELGRLVPQDRLPSQLALRDLDASPRLMRYRLLATGEERWAVVKAIPVRDNRGEIEYVVSVFSDITERRQAEEALRASEARFHALLDNSPVVAFIKDEEGRFVYVSRPFARLFGSTPEKVVGTIDTALVPREILEGIRRDDKEVLATGRLKEVVELIPDAAGATRYWLTFKFPITDEEGQRFIGGASVEVTERLRAEEALQQYAARLKVISRQLIGSLEGERKRIARELHDQIGQALTAIKIDLQIAQQAAARAEGVSPRIEHEESPHIAFEQRLERGIELVERTIQQVREFSLDLRPSILDDLGLPSALLWYAEEQAGRAGFEVELAIEQIDARLSPELEIACFRIAQEAITNVVRHAEATRVTVQMRQGGGNLMLTVSDNGAGFDQEALAAEIAGRNAGDSEDLYRQVGDARGSKDVSMIRGLGLEGMNERVLLVGGCVRIESAPGKGTTVQATFPLPVPQPASTTFHL